ncbi:hemolysin family protein [Caulobacter sp.]|uniref:hemolysin family protein n=1 Tax=Caulobacter sp. TaxID=78 RepID=UPI002B4845E7|nr:hemolysin family protein [Caulobacter sp.]HJV41953.1 hemolysin family protein [Caulobacter sp.]
MILVALAVVFLLVLLNGVFSMSELAVVSARKARLQGFAERGDHGAKLALEMAEHPTRFLSAVQVGITLIGIFAGAYGQATIASALDKWLEGVPPIARYSEAIATTVVVIGLTYVSVILGELVPKRLALMFPDAIARRMSPFLAIVATVLRPFVTLLTVSTAAVLKLMGVRDERNSGITSEEVETVLAEGADAGLIEPEERAMINEVLRLGDRPVRVAMTPRRDLFWVSLADDTETVLREIRASAHSRILVATEDDLDGDIGVVLKKDLLDACLADAPLDLKAHVQQPVAIPETMSLLKALAVFKQTSLHMALVVDEFGSLQGAITPLDLLEMIAGDFPEDHDDDETRIIRREDGSWLIDARLDIQELNDQLGENFEADGGYHTVAGLILDRLGRIPAEGEHVTIGGFDIEIVDMDSSRIDKVILKPNRRKKGDAEG